MAKQKKFKLECGMVVTAQDIVNATGVSRSTAVRRLRGVLKFELVFAKRYANVGHDSNTGKPRKEILPFEDREKYNPLNDKKLKEMILRTKPFYDPMYRLWNKTITNRKIRTKALKAIIKSIKRARIN